jgi:nitrite reductase/ring-hydroxylating ferredoxin subunit
MSCALRPPVRKVSAKPTVAIASRGDQAAIFARWPHTAKAPHRAAVSVAEGPGLCRSAPGASAGCTARNGSTGFAFDLAATIIVGANDVNQAVEIIERQQWLRPLEDGLQTSLRACYEGMGESGRSLQDFLHGKWLGHPLHAVLTDVPVGAWTAAAVLDCVRNPAADSAIRIGLAGAAAAAAAGLTDWHVTDGKARRIGLVHGILNITAAGLYTASLFKRAAGDRAAGRALAFAGYALAAASAYLGGALVYTERIGVTHAPPVEGQEGFVPVLAEAELLENQLRRVEVNDTRMLLVRRAGRVHAIAEVCAHLGGPLAEGTLDGEIVECPWHGSRFSIVDGAVVNGPSVHPQPCYETRVRDGQIEVRPARC